MGLLACSRGSQHFLSLAHLSVPLKYDFGDEMWFFFSNYSFRLGTLAPLVDSVSVFYGASGIVGFLFLEKVGRCL